jgi:hypothetical protein
MAGVAIAIAGIAVATAFMALGLGNAPVSAQEKGCGDNEFGALCLRKDTGGASGSFVFEIEGDERANLGSQVTEPCFEAVLGGGDEILIYFNCEVRVTERPERGWHLVTIDCDYDNTYYDVVRSGNSVLILLDQGSKDSVNPISEDAQRLDIECTFVNRPDPQPNIGAGLSGLFKAPTPLPTAPAAVAPATPRPISPPNTGDGGLK